MFTTTENYDGKTLLIENYTITSTPALSPINEDNERTVLCLTLGLVGQVEMGKQKRIPYPQLSREEFRVWRAFLPTPYRPYNDRPNHWYRINNYVYDVIPITALRIMRDAKVSGVFSEIQIWTPERIAHDPIAVGAIFKKHTTDEFYLLCRWGESLIPFNQIKRKVRWRLLRNLIHW